MQHACGFLFLSETGRGNFKSKPLDALQSKMCSQNGNTQLQPPPLNCMAQAALLQLLDFSLGRGPWESRRPGAAPRRHAWGCCMSFSLLGGLCSTPTADHLLSLSLQESSHAGTKAAGHPAGAAPGDSQAGPGGDLTSSQQVWLRGAGGEHPWAGAVSTACSLASMGCPAPCFCLRVCCARCPWLGQELTQREGQKGHPQKGSLAMQGAGSCSAVPTPAPCHAELKSCNFPMFN